MITKLYNLKKIQLDQEFATKQQFMAQIYECDERISDLQNELSTAGVKMFGAISDFKILAIHKNSLRYEQEKLKNMKKSLEQKVELLNGKIVSFHKELEQYKYILEQEKYKKIKKQEKNDELIASEYMQAKWVSQL